MSARQLLQCLQQSAAASLWPGARVLATGVASISGPTGITAAASSASSASLWRSSSSFSTETSTSLPADSAPWSPGIASSSTSSSAPHGAPQPAVLRPVMFAESFRSPVKSLQFNRGAVVYLPQLENNPLGRGLLYVMGAYSQKQQLRNGACVLYQSITEAAESTDLQQALGLEVGSFMAPFNLLSLHMWLIINRLHQEADSKDNKFFLDTLYHDYFYKDVDRRVHAYGVKIRVGKWVDTLQKQFYGTSFAYDKAIRVEGGGQAQHAALVAALLKNVYNGDVVNKPWAELTARYLLRELQCLSATDVEAVYKGQIRFSTDIIRSS